MFFSGNRRLVARSGAALLLSFASSACGVKMINYEELQLKAADIAEAAPSAVAPVEYAPEPPAIVVCDPFSNGGAADAKKGIRATLHYYESGDPRTNAVNFTTDFVPGTPGVVTSDSVIYLGALDVPTRAFNDGFVTNGGQLLQTLSSEPLVEWFSLRMASNFVAPTVQEEGDYQFALDSDDGSVLQVDEDRDGNFEDLVLNDARHAPQVRCASRSVHLKAGDPLPFRLNYFQGPRYHIALRLLWKKLSGPAQGLGCTMNELSVVPEQVYELEAGRQNPCLGN